MSRSLHSIARSATGGISMTPASDFGLSAIEQIAVTAKDIERATAFYKQKLGMKHLFSAPPGLAFFDCDGIRLMLSLPSSPEFDHPSSIIYFKVDDIQLAYETLTGRGVVFEEKPHFLADLGSFDLWMASFRDSEDNFLAMMSHVPKNK
jgi:predicted enzyme related to lactoylglutathione lyase